MSSFPLTLEQYLWAEGAPTFPEPLATIAGDTLTWPRQFQNYPASAGWTLAYVLNSPTARFVVNPADITPSGDGFTIAIPGSETQTWTPGTYQWLAVVQLAAANGNPAQRFTVALGSITVTADILDATTPQDTRSANEIALAAIDIMLSGRASDGVQEYMINGRSLRRYSIAELITLRSHLASKVRQERANRGEDSPSKTVAINF